MPNPMHPLSELFNSIEKSIHTRYFKPANKKEKRLKLEETGSAASCREVHYDLGNIEVLTYKFDEGETEIFSFLAEPSPLRSKPDFLMFCLKPLKNNEFRIYAVVCNLKSGQKSNMEAQLNAGHLFLEFLLKTALRAQSQWFANQAMGYYQLEDYPTLLKEDKIRFVEFAVYSSSKPIQKGDIKPKHRIIRRRIQFCGTKAHSLETELN